MAEISRTIAQYKTLEQLQDYAAAQEQMITQLSKKIQKLESDKKVTPISPDSSKLLNLKELGETDAEQICNLEMSKLKEASLSRELTLEEARRCEIYFKILKDIKSKEQKSEKEVEKLEQNDLLKLIELNGNAKQ